MPYQFEVAKLSRMIKRYGIEVTFNRDKLDEFGEPTGEYTEVAKFPAVYHESTTHISITTNDDGNVQSKVTPYLSASYDSVKGDSGMLVQQGDTTTINGTKYRVNGISDLSNLNILCQISLEVVLDGGD